jgi:hypothetical protein
MAPLSIYSSKLIALFTTKGLTDAEQSFIDIAWTSSDRATKMDQLDQKQLEIINTVFNKYFKD